MYLIINNDMVNIAGVDRAEDYKGIWTLGNYYEAFNEVGLGGDIYVANIANTANAENMPGTEGGAVWTKKIDALPTGQTPGSMLVAGADGTFEAGVDKDPQAKSLTAIDAVNAASVNADAVVISDSGLGNTTQIEPDGTVTVNTLETNLSGIPVPYATVAANKAASGVDTQLCYCDETATTYEYVAAGSGYTADDLYVFITGDGGDTRWIGVAGRYIAGPGSAGVLINPSATELTWGSELLANPNLDSASDWTYTNGAAWNAAGEAWLYNGVINTVTVVNGGTGYTVGDVLTIADGTGGTVTVATAPAGIVGSVTVTTSGYGYSVATHATSGGTGGGNCTIGVATLKSATITQNVTFEVGAYYRLTLTFVAGSTGIISGHSAGGWYDGNNRSASCVLYFKAVTASSSVTLPSLVTNGVSSLIKLTSISLVKKTASCTPIIQAKGSDGTILFQRCAASGAGRLGTIVQGAGGAGENLSNSPGAIIMGYAAAPMLQDSLTADSVVIIGSGAGGNVQNSHSMTIIGGGAATGTSLTAASMIRATCMGYQAGASATTLANAVCIGPNTGQSNTALSNAVTIGYQASRSGSSNESVVVGTYAGQNGTLTNGVAIGMYAGYNNTGGTGVFVGKNAGFQTALGGGAGCVFLGYQAGKECTTANTLIIHNTSDITNPTVFGDMSNRRLGIAVSPATNRFHIGYGHLQFDPVVAPTACTAAVNPAAGVLTGAYTYKITFVTANGETEVGTVSNTVNPAGEQVNLTAIPVSTNPFVTDRKIYRCKAATATSWYYLAAMGNNTVTTYTDNTADGSLGAARAAQNTTSSRLFIGSDKYGEFTDSNLGLGYLALGSSTLTGNYNVGLGKQSLRACSTGQNNVAVGGYNTLYALQTGTHNVGVGNEALSTITTDSYNTAVGSLAGKSLAATATSRVVCVGYRAGIKAGTDSVIIGADAAYNSSGKINNVVIGGYAGYLETEANGGRDNTLIGYAAGFYQDHATGTNVMIGSESGRLAAAGGGSGNVFLGYQAGKASTASNTLIIENSSDITTPLIMGDFSANTLTFNGAVTITGKLAYGISVVKTATGDLTAAEVTNTIINNYGQGAETTLTLPAAAAGMNFMLVISTTGNAIHIKAGASDKIYLDGTALDDGDKVSLAVPAVANSATFITIQTGAAAWDWVCQTILGVFTDGGA